jgi:hypothetical protein
MSISASNIAVEFTRALIEGRFVDAHRLFSRQLRKEVSLAELEYRYRNMAAYDEGIFTQFEEMEGRDEWPDKQPGDVRWAYVSITGKSARHAGLISEAVQVVVASEENQPVIRFLEFGRP